MQTAKHSQTILVLMDFSDVSYMALKYAISLAKIWKRSIKLFHVFPSTIIDSDDQTVNLNDVEKYEREVISTFSSIVEIIQAEGVGTSYALSRGHLTTSMIQEVTELQPELIVIGRNKINTSCKTIQILIKNFSGCILSVGAPWDFRENSKICLVTRGEKTNPINLELLAEICMSANVNLNWLDTTDTGKLAINGLDSARINQIYSEESYSLGGLENAKTINKVADNENVGLLCLTVRSRKFSYPKKKFGKKQLAPDLLKHTNRPILLICS